MSAPRYIAITRCRCRPRGAILLLVLGAVAILSILAIELSNRATLDVARAARAVKESAFQRGFESGGELAKGLLIERRKSVGFDYWGDGWSQIVSTTLDENIHIRVQVNDESGKFNLNNLAQGADPNARKSLGRIFEYLRLKEPNRETDWQLAESAFAKKLGLDTDPAQASQSQPVKNPLLTLDGLRECGLPRQLVFGELNATSENHTALCDLFTVFGGATINVNTAPKAVIYGLDNEYTQQLSDNVCAFRGGISATAERFTPFRTQGDLESIDGMVEKTKINGQTVIIKNLAAKVRNQITFASTCFSVRVVVEVGGHTREKWLFFDSRTVAKTNEDFHLLAQEEIEQ